MSNIKEILGGKKVDDTLEVVNDFKCQIPYWGYQVAAYKNSEPFNDLIPVLDTYLEKLFTGELDDGNGDVLDCLIADYARENMKYLAQQRVEHRSMLKMFEVQRQGARQTFENHLTAMEELKEEKGVDMENIEKRCKADKFERRNENA